MKFTKIIVINPPSPPGYVSNKDSMGGFGQLFPVGATPFPPLDLIYLASYLAQQNCSPEILESLAHELDKEQLIAKIEALNNASADKQMLVVVRTSAPTIDWDLSICRQIKAKIKTADIAIYGPVVSNVLDKIEREDSLTYIIKGDPDETVEALFKGAPESEINNLLYRSQNEWIENASKPFIRELDKLPFPKWEMLPFQKYRLPKSSTSAETAFLPIWSSRGCPIGCHYCPYPIGQGLPWRYRSAQNVVNEMEHLVKDLGIEYILFRDPMFSLNQRRVIEICNEIARRGIKVGWRCETRIDFLNEETLRAMAQAGCEGINFGVESSDVEIQSGVGRKPITPEMISSHFALCRELGIKTFGFFIIGLPGDTVETILKTIKFAVQIKPHWVQFTAASPFIGTKLRDWAIEHELVAKDDHSYINSHEAIMGNENLSVEQIRSLLHVAQFIQNYLINRKGFFKSVGKSSPVYQSAKSAADAGCDWAAKLTLAFAKFRFAKKFSRQRSAQTVLPAKS